MSPITAQDVQAMVSHWLNTPVHGYLGSDYGNDLTSLLQQAFSGGKADELIAKLRADVPALSVFPDGMVNVYGIQTPPDRLDLVIEVAGMAVPVRLS